MKGRGKVDEVQLACLVEKKILYRSFEAEG